MRTILEAEGYKVTSVGQAMQALGEEERFLYPDTDEGRQQILDDYRTFLPKFWVVKPKAAELGSLITSLRQAA